MAGRKMSVKNVVNAREWRQPITSSPATPNAKPSTTPIDGAQCFSSLPGGGDVLKD
jgi:hypothetical protein